MAEKQYDLIVIGAGPGGYLPAIRAAKAGKKTAIVEKGHVGGTCLNFGCIPTKTYLHTAELFGALYKAEAGGLFAEQIHVDMRRLKARKDQVVHELRDGIEKQLAACDIDLYRGTASILSENRVAVRINDRDAAVKELTAKFILAATGAKASRPSIPGIFLPGVEDSASMLEKERMYDRLIIIGGGVIGMEFATIYQALGCQVTVLEAMDRILPGMDREISQNLRMILKRRGVAIQPYASVKRIDRTGEETLRCSYTVKETESIQEADGILVAVGRRPCGEAVFSEECRQRVFMDRGRIGVNEHYETSIPGVYAVGDAIGGRQLAHVATAEGYCALAHMFQGMRGKDLSAVVSCVYTDPEIACVGMTADEAKTAGIPAKTGKYIMSLNGKSVLSMQERGFIKIVAEEESGRILGAQLMCARATDLAGELALAITKGMTAKDLAAVVMPHPTFGEGVGEAAEAIL